jgi:hypothetical protein
MAYLSGANLSEADLSGVSAVVSAGLPDKWPAFGWMNNGVLSVRVGCRTKTMAEARAYWMGKPDRQEVMAALDYIQAVAAIRAGTDAYWKGE